MTGYYLQRAQQLEKELADMRTVARCWLDAIDSEDNEAQQRHMLRLSQMVGHTAPSLLDQTHDALSATKEYHEMDKADLVAIVKERGLKMRRGNNAIKFLIDLLRKDDQEKARRANAEQTGEQTGEAEQSEEDDQEGEAEDQDGADDPEGAEDQDGAEEGDEE